MRKFVGHQASSRVALNGTSRDMLTLGIIIISLIPIYAGGRSPVEMWWHKVTHGRGSKGKLANGVGSQYSHATTEHDVSSITTADAHTSAASSRLNWRPRRFKRTRPFRRKTKFGFCACAITFQTQSTSLRRNQSTLSHAIIVRSTLILPFHMLLTSLLVSSSSFPVKIVYTFISHACCVPYCYPSMYHPVFWRTVQMISSLLRIYALLSIASSPFCPNIFLSTLSRDILSNIPVLALWWETKFYTHP